MYQRNELPPCKSVDSHCVPSIHDNVGVSAPVMARVAQGADCCTDHAGDCKTLQATSCPFAEQPRLQVERSIISATKHTLQVMWCTSPQAKVNSTCSNECQVG